VTTHSDLPQRTIRIRTGSRLHFGLLDTAAPFGGIGVMIDRPVTEVVISPASKFTCLQSFDRGREIALRLCEMLGQDFSESGKLPACLIEIKQRAEPHHGLGTGTQLSLAIAEGLARFCDADLTNEIVATQIAARGKRSAVGSHGYFQGGLLYESSAVTGPLNQVQQRIELPETWRVLVFRPTQSEPTVSGSYEQDQFDRLGSAQESERDRLQEMIQSDLIPAAQSADFEGFCSALGHYNHASGMLFSSVQGGPYSSPAIARLVGRLQSSGAKGVGQSSWGPSVFSWFESESAANDFVANLPTQDIHVMQCQVQNAPRSLEVS